MINKPKANDTLSTNFPSNCFSKKSITYPLLATVRCSNKSKTVSFEDHYCVWKLWKNSKLRCSIEWVVHKKRSEKLGFYIKVISGLRMPELRQTGKKYKCTDVGRMGRHQFCSTKSSYLPGCNIMLFYSSTLSISIMREDTVSPDSFSNLFVFTQNYMASYKRLRHNEPKLFFCKIRVGLESNRFR